MNHRIVRFAAACAALALALSCKPKDDDEDAGVGMVSIAITDAASDQISTFVVDIAAIQLHRANGAVVSVLSTPITVDLVNLTDLSQVINVLTLPAAFYTSGSITLDFTNAKCVMVGGTGPMTIHDHAGNPVTGQLVLPLSFGSGFFAAIANRHRVVELDFDLNQSVSVDIMANTIRLEPAFVMRVDPANPKELITIGTLTSVNTAGGTFVADVKRLGGPVISTVTFAAGGLTLYQIDGVPSLGAAGLAALAAKGPGTWIQTYGAINVNAAVINVLYVEAGTGTYYGGSDIIEGHIIGRTGAAGADATLSVFGHSNNAAHTVFQFHQVFTVNTTFANTKVVRRGSLAAFDSDDLNVGQRVRVFGALTGLTMDATAASAVVRQQPCHAWGTANGAPSGSTLQINLSGVDLRSTGTFAWNESGANPPNPALFNLEIGTLGGGLGITAGTVVVARGFFSAFDAAGADFTAVSLTNATLAPSFLLIRDLPNGRTVLTTTSPTQIQFTFSGVPVAWEAAVIDKAFVGAGPLPSPATVTANSGFTIYAIRDASDGSLAIYLGFSEFSASLGTRLVGGKTLYHFGAVGPWTAGPDTMAASIAVAVVY